MAMIAVPISHDISRLFKQVDVEARRDPSDHITMFYLGDDLPVKNIAKMMPFVFEETSKFKPFDIEISKITTFDKGKYGYPIIAEIKSKEIHDLRNKLKSVFKKNNIKFDEKFPEYKPHITLGYSDEKIKDIKFDKIKFIISEIAIFGGDKHDEKVFVNFPFTLNLSKKAKVDVLSNIYLQKVKLS